MAACCQEAVSQAVGQMEEALYHAHAAHERAAMGLKHSEENVLRRDGIIAALSAELADTREALRLHSLAAERTIDAPSEAAGNGGGDGDSDGDSDGDGGGDGGSSSGGGGDDGGGSGGDPAWAAAWAAAAVATSELAASDLAASTQGQLEEAAVRARVAIALTAERAVLTAGHAALAAEGVAQRVAAGVFAAEVGSLEERLGRQRCEEESARASLLELQAKLAAFHARERRRLDDEAAAEAAVAADAADADAAAEAETAAAEQGDGEACGEMADARRLLREGELLAQAVRQREAAEAAEREARREAMVWRGKCETGAAAVAALPALAARQAAAQRDAAEARLAVRQHEARTEEARAQAARAALDLAAEIEGGDALAAAVAALPRWLEAMLRRGGGGGGGDAAAIQAAGGAPAGGARRREAHCGLMAVRARLGAFCDEVVDGRAQLSAAQEAASRQARPVASLQPTVVVR